MSCDWTGWLPTAPPSFGVFLRRPRASRDAGVAVYAVPPDRNMTDTWSPERWRQIERVLDGMLDTPPEDRAGLLDEACASDAELRVAVEELLRADALARGFLQEPAGELASPLLANLSPASDPAAPGMRIGPYRIIQEAGRGGMAVVYLAERDDGAFHKRVALKLVRAGMILEDDDLLRRFREERQILASLEHPGIARLLDGGVTAEGLPWFAMEYVQGTPIERYCDDRRLDIEARLELFCAVCDAVQHAHRNQIVHRDLKPSNILVSDGGSAERGEGQVKLLDFGIAKLLAVDCPDDEAERTRPGARLMTPEYASPEQVRGGVITPAADVYALGVLLYRLLCGRHPYAIGGRADRVEEAVLETCPEPPSTTMREPGRQDGADSHAFLAEMAAARQASLAQLRRRLRGDLDAIVLKTLRKTAVQRYGTAGGLAAEIRRHLVGQSVAARREARVHRLRASLGSGRVTAAILLAAVVLAISGYWAAVGFFAPAPMNAEAEQPAPLFQGVADPAAYDLYRRARDYTARMRREDSDIGIGLLRNALTIDSSFALARARLAVNYAVALERYGWGEEWADSAIAQAQHALARDAQLPDAYKALGVAYRYKGWLQRSLEAHERAVALDSTSSLGNVGLAYATLGRPDEALRLYALIMPKAAPDDRPVILLNRSVAYAWLGLFAEAEESHRRAAELAPDLPLIQRQAIRLAMLQGDDARAVALAEALVTRHAGPDTWTFAGRAQLAAGDLARARVHLERAHAASPNLAADLLAAVLWKSGDRARARRLYDEYEADARSRIARGSERWELRHGLGVMNAVRGERSEAYRWLEEAVALGFVDYYRTTTDPLLAALRGEPEFERLLTRQKASIEEMRQRVEREGW